ncbi:MAG: hypothetical protein R2715_24765 [Ilumatobacteraceae bacterium]
MKGTIHPYRGEWLEFDVEQKPEQGRHRRHRVARKRRMSIFTIPAPSATTRRSAPGFLDRFVNYFDFLEGQWEKDRPRSDPGRVAGRDLQAGVGRAADRRVGPGRRFRNAFFENRRYDLSRVGRPG